MPKYLEYVAIFHTRLIKRPYNTIILDPVKVEVINGPLTFVVPVFMGGSLPAGEQHMLTGQKELRLAGDATYLIITARVYDLEGSPEEEGKEKIDRTTAMLCLLYSPELFSQPLYRGFKANAERIQIAGWLKLTHPILIEDAVAKAGMQTISKTIAIDEDLNRRFGLMARFLSKAAAYPPGEERFVMLWTILEIFPMKDTTDIAPIAEYLAPIVGHSAIETKKGLSIGRLFGARSDLVHNGVLPIPIAEYGKTLGRLESICLCTMRSLGGLPYDNSLDTFFDEPEKANSSPDAV
jgi:hypothetical protein